MSNTEKALKCLNIFSCLLAVVALVAFMMIGIKFKELEATEKEIKQLRLQELDRMAEKVLEDMTGEKVSRDEKERIR